MIRDLTAAGPRGIGPASTAWNAGFDAGTAVGAVLVGGIATSGGLATGMAVAAAVCLASMPLTLLRPHRSLEHRAG